jgi:hypothetical protein
MLAKKTVQALENWWNIAPKLKPMSKCEEISSKIIFFHEFHKS